MPRVKRGTIAHKKREKILKQTKGFRWRRKTNERAAKEALLHAWEHAFRGRKEKKRNMRALWQVKISAAAQKNGLSYSRLMGGLKKANVKLDRKVLAEFAERYPKIFKAVMEKAK